MPTSTDDLRKQWGAAIQARRGEVGWSQSRLAHEVGVQKETISRIERGVFGGSDDTRMRIAEALGVEVNDLYRFPTAEGTAP